MSEQLAAVTGSLVHALVQAEARGGADAAELEGALEVGVGPASMRARRGSAAASWPAGSAACSRGVPYEWVRA